MQVEVNAGLKREKVMRGISLLAALLTLTLSGPLAAQEQAVDPLAQATEKLRQDRKRLVEANLQLTSAEAERFWPLYEQFEKDLDALQRKRSAIIAEFGENYDAMTDDMARKILTDRLQLDEERARLRKAYLPRFEKVLPVKKLARYYQIESKIQASVEAGIAEEIPLIK